MKNSKKYIVSIIISLIIIVAIVIGINIYLNSNHLTINERKWIAEKSSSSQVININVINDANVFGFSGEGVYYDFLEDFADEYDLNINKATFNYGTNVSGVSLNAKNNLLENDILIYKDHYVLVGTDLNIINSINDLHDTKIGVLTSDLAYITSYIEVSGITFNTYDNVEDLYESLSENDYVIMPLYLNLDTILKGNYYINYHFSDINMYYTLSLLQNDELSSILSKYYEKWKDDFKEEYNESLFNVMVESLSITETEIDAMKSINYKYGFINNSPYEVITNGNYGGIVSVYLSGFMDFADLDFNFKKYNSYNKFNKALAKNEIDLYFGYYNTNTSFNKTKSGINSKYYFVANNKNNVVINSVNSLKGKTVYVDANSYLYTYISKVSGINIETYKDTKELLKLNKKDVIILIDSNIFDYYQNHGLNNYSIRMQDYADYIYTFNVNKDTAIYKLLDRYVNIIDSNEVLNEGLYNHEKIMQVGTILTYIAKYFILILLFTVVIIYIIVKKTRKVKIAKKIKKDDKLKFIDQLTMLKNRNYLTENLSSWSKNTIYPQAVVVIDLNHLQHINDIEGYEEGDKQIKSAANALMKTQLDNSDIIRTDGNEFVVYLVGYSQKQVTNYIHKLNKEFNKLPYNYGAEFGYSMILDDIKTIEDALNEATKALKMQKELNEDKN